MDEEKRRAFLASRAAKQGQSGRSGADRAAAFQRGGRRGAADNQPTSDVATNNNNNNNNNDDENQPNTVENNGSQIIVNNDNGESKSEIKESAEEKLQNRRVDRRAAFQNSKAAHVMAGKKEVHTHESMTICREEVMAYALDEAIRIYYQLSQEKENSGSKYNIHRDTSLQLRQIVLDLFDSLDQHYKEISFTIPDPAVLKAKNEVKIKEQQENHKMNLLYKKLALDPSFLSLDDNPANKTSSDSPPLDQNIPPNPAPPVELKPAPQKEEKAEENKNEEESSAPSEQPRALRGRAALAAAGKSRGGGRRGGGQSGGTSQRLQASRPVLERDGTVSRASDEVPNIQFNRTLIEIDLISKFLTEKIQNQIDLFPLPPSTSSIEYYSHTVKGPRATNEDELVVVEHAIPFLTSHSSLPHDYSFVGVYDGHSGKKASFYSRSQLHYNVFNQPHFDSNLYKAIHDGFLLTDERLTDIQHRERLSCGTTALSVWINNHSREIVVANVGDCRGYFYQNHTAVEVCNPHTLQREDEKERILCSGGAVACVYGTWRVNGTLAVTRSIGDINIKYLLIPDPEITTFQATDEGDEYLLIASDGLWDVMEVNDVVEFVKQTPRQNICKFLCEEALVRKSKDNVTVVIVYFNKKSDNS